MGGNEQQPHGVFAGKVVLLDISYPSIVLVSVFLQRIQVVDEPMHDLVHPAIGLYHQISIIPLANGSYFNEKPFTETGCTQSKKSDCI